MGAESVPRREVVTAGPRTDRGRLPRPVHPPGAVPATPADDTAVTALMRRQLRAALTATALLVGSLGLLPVLLRLLPLADTRPSVPPAVWLVLGVAPYPALLCTGAWYVRRAERNEDDVTAR
ncbi:hypothetical protein [Streptomyces sp. NPDC020362]|uniref:hypothetical protein n=1 Tax=unclassified Streptomyces TaxID=2593676 RepID=UPI000A8D8EFD